eukprot:2851964-Rhodomonas_salina.1
MPWVLPAAWFDQVKNFKAAVTSATDIKVSSATAYARDLRCPLGDMKLQYEGSQKEGLEKRRERAREIAVFERLVGSVDNVDEKEGID